MFDFFETFYKGGFITIEKLKKATKWNVISKEEFKTITGEDYISE